MKNEKLEMKKEKGSGLKNRQMLVGNKVDKWRLTNKLPSISCLLKWKNM